LYHIVHDEWRGCFISKFLGSGVSIVSPLLVVPFDPEYPSVSFVSDCRFDSEETREEEEEEATFDFFFLI